MESDPLLNRKSVRQLLATEAAGVIVAAVLIGIAVGMGTGPGGGFAYSLLFFVVAALLVGILTAVAMGLSVQRVAQLYVNAIRQAFAWRKADSAL
jgi:hypothetical protein